MAIDLIFGLTKWKFEFGHLKNLSMKEGGLFVLFCFVCLSH
jgi:hypothetical protein